MAFMLKSELIICLALILGAWAWHKMLHNPTIAEQHEQWMANYGRTYNDPQEKAMRQAIFTKNLQFIEDFNKSGNRTFKLGLNQFSDLTNEEFVRSHTGCLAPRRPEPAITTSVSHQKLTGDVPDHIDWVEKGVVNAIKYQGHCGSCWAFSVVAAVEGIVGITNGTLPVLSEQQLVDCVTTNFGCGGGYLEYAFEYIIQNQGIASEDSYPYEAEQGTCDATKAEEHAAQIKGFTHVPSGEDELTKAVAQQPVSVIIPSSGQEFQYYSGGVFNGECGPTLDHAVVVVGYGTSEEGTDFWKIRNSWGETWGERGYMRIQRGSGSSEGICKVASAASYPTV
ncbi:ervatamin-B-like [Eucalyptus grandis]|uniref:ervatamin-B-like n=1 Tax=Eucalyptus grandis TaxID=71139 RepID=UPI00192EFCDF|nr:ervatamin-B-like [Eucalyptus grandis]